MWKVVKSASAATATLITFLFATVFLAAMFAGCNVNAAGSDTAGTATAALSTLSYYSTLEPTLTVQAAAANRALIVEPTMTALTALNADLVNQLNAASQSSGQANIPTIDPNAGINSVTAAPAGTVAPGTNLAFDKVVMSKGIDASTGCAVNETTTFAVTDSNIYVVASVHNYKAGTVFTAAWSGGDIPSGFSNSWKATRDGAQICVHFYIQPRVLNLKAGQFNVMLSATGLDGQSLSFTLGGPTQSGTNTLSPDQNVQSTAQTTPTAGN